MPFTIHDKKGWKFFFQPFLYAKTNSKRVDNLKAPLIELLQLQ